MSSEDVERFREHAVYPNHPSKEGEYVRYSDHERIVKELEEAHQQKVINLEAAAAYDAGNARAAIKKWGELRAQPSLSDAIKEVERLYDEWWDIDRRRWLNVVLERLKSLSTQEGEGSR